MVSLKWLFLAALSSVSVVLADDVSADDAAAQAYWDSVNLSEAVEGDAPDKRDILKIPRTNPPAYMLDPYAGSKCKAPYTKPPCATTCNRNNCFRGLLNARDGSA